MQTPGQISGLEKAARAAAAGSPQIDPSTVEGIDALNAALAEAGPRRIVGLVVNRLMNYVMADGTIRPFLIVNAFDGTGKVNGILFFDGVHDRSRQVVHLGVDSSGHVPEFALLISSVDFSEDLLPGTIHFPAKQGVIASSVDPEALATQLVAVTESEFKKQSKILTEQLIELVNDKLQANLEAVTQVLDSYREFVDSLARGLPDTTPAKVEFQNLNEAIAACGKDELVNISPDGKITIAKISPEEVSQRISQGHVVRELDEENPAGEDTANAATGADAEGTGQAAEASGGAQATS